MLKTELEVIAIGKPNIVAIRRIAKPNKVLTDSCAYVRSTPRATIYLYSIPTLTVL